MHTDEKIVIYNSSDGTPELRVTLDQESIWLMQRQIADLFGTQVPAIAKHIRNIIREGELKQDATISKMEIVQKRRKERYNLDMIISVGYRVNSKQANSKDSNYITH